MVSLIKVTEKDGQQLVDARELHDFLGVGRDFSSWLKQRIEKYGFVENQDFTSFTKSGEREIGGTTRIEYAITIDMAKELSMVENNEQGRKARKYFIACEKKLKESQIMLPNFNDPAEAAIAWANMYRQKKALEAEAAENAPKVDYFEKTLASENAWNVTAVAEKYGMSALKLNHLLCEYKIQYKNSGTYILYAPYKDKGYTQSRTVTMTRKGNITAYLQTMWTQKGRKFIYDVLKKHGIVPLVENIYENKCD